MRIWTISNQKGGVGKTTSSVTLGGIAAAEGKRVLLLDLDPHGSLTSYFGYDPDDVPHSLFDIFQEPSNVNVAGVASTILHSQETNLHLIPSVAALATLERHGVGKEGMGLVISRALKCLEDDYDLAILDTPPQLGVLMVNALAACEKLVVPVQTEHLAIKGLERMLHTLDMLAKSRGKPLDYSIIPTMFDRRTQASVSSLRVIRNAYEAQVWPGKIPVDTKFRDASKDGLTPVRFNPSARGVEAYQSLFKWLWDDVQ